MANLIQFISDLWAPGVLVGAALLLLKRSLRTSPRPKPPVKESARCEVIRITTPQKYFLDGLWFGGDQPQRGLVFVHGLTDNAFSNHELVVPLANQDTAVVTFSNRGHGKISETKKEDIRKKRGYRPELIGEAHEVFTDCVDDLQGAVDYIKSRGVEDIFLVGHSTGCQKSIYYLSRRGKQDLIKGVILLCPVSDYAASPTWADPENLRKATRTARRLVKKGQPHTLLPTNIWPALHDAQRFLSLYTPDSEEEIFTYAQPGKPPTTLRKITIPTLAIYAGEDEYHSRPTKEITQWFRENSRAEDLVVTSIDGALHNFTGHTDEIIRLLRPWLQIR